jgi:uncharacterized protein
VIVVVSDTSPIRALEFLGKLELLERLFGIILLPPAVAKELEEPRPRFHSIDLGNYLFFKVMPLKDLAQVREFRTTLDAGEAEALVLAIEKHADFVLMDESLGRNIARELGITPLGVVGILLRAKELQLINMITPLLDQLKSELDFFISPSLRQEIIRQAGE